MGAKSQRRVAVLELFFPSWKPFVTKNIRVKYAVSVFGLNQTEVDYACDDKIMADPGWVTRFDCARYANLRPDPHRLATKIVDMLGTAVLGG